MGQSAARQISYASSVEGRGAQTFVRMVENATGRPALIRRAAGYEADLAAGADFWTVMAARYGLSLEITRGALSDIPAEGPLILLSNHPFGILDGLMMGHLLARARPSFRILAHEIFGAAEEIGEVILPVSFDKTSEAIARNIRTRHAALDHLGQGGAIGIFPGGTVSTAARPFGRPVDPNWRTFTAKMIARSGATVLPVWFEGQNSRFFQLCSHLHPTLRTALFVREFRARVDRPVRIAIGTPIAPATLAPLTRDPKALMTYLRGQTYALSGQPRDAETIGYEFESHHKQRPIPAV